MQTANPSIKVFFFSTRRNKLRIFSVLQTRIILWRTGREQGRKDSNKPLSMDVPCGYSFSCSTYIYGLPYLCSRKEFKRLFKMSVASLWQASQQWEERQSRSSLNTNSELHSVLLGFPVTWGFLGKTAQPLSWIN